SLGFRAAVAAMGRRNGDSRRIGLRRLERGEFFRARRQDRTRVVAISDRRTGPLGADFFSGRGETECGRRGRARDFRVCAGDAVMTRNHDQYFVLRTNFSYSDSTVSAEALPDSTRMR